MHPLSTLKFLDLSPETSKSPSETLGAWGAERLPLPVGLDLAHAEGMRILLMLVQEVDILLGEASRVESLDLALLHEYNPMLIACVLAPEANPWAATSAVLAAVMHRGRTGLGQVVRVPTEGPPEFSGFTPLEPSSVDHERLLERLGYDAQAIATLRHTGVLPV